MICPIPKLTVPTFPRARCVPDETANHGYWQSLADTSACQLTCERTGPSMAAYVLLSNRSECGVKSPLIIAAVASSRGQRMGTTPKRAYDRCLLRVVVDLPRTG